MDFTNYDVRRQAHRTAFENFLRKRAEQVESAAKKSGVILELSVDGTVAADVLYRMAYDACRLDGPSLIKRSALFTFWVKKLKPIQVNVMEPVQEREYHRSENAPETWQRYGNEIVAFLGASSALTSWRKVRFRSEFMMEFFYDLRFRSWSPNGLMLVYQAIWGRVMDGDGDDWSYAVVPHD